jgi:phage tail sheath gpL-like
MAANLISGLLYPLTQIGFDNSQAGVNQQTYPTMLIAQTITAAPNALTPVTSVAQARALYGRGSRLARMFEAYFNNDSTGPIYCLPRTDASGASAATGTFAFSGTATASGTVFAYIGGQLVQVGVTTGMTASQVASAMVAQIALQPDLLVSAATGGTGGVNCVVTAKNLGTLGNAIDLRLNYLGAAGGQALPAGLAVTITAMTGGATDPVYTDVAGILGDTNMYFIVHDNASSAVMTAMTAMMNFTTGRWAPNRKTWGHVFTALPGLAATLSTFGQGYNDPHTTVWGYETGSPTPSCEWAGAFTGAAAVSLRNQPNQPLQTLNVNFVSPPPVGLAEASGGAFSKTSWQLLLGSGIALAQYAAGNMPQILRAPTTYETNAYGQPDQSYFDTGDMFTLMFIGNALNAMETQKWGRNMVADDGNAFGPGLPIVTPKSALSDLAALYATLEYEGLVEDASAMLAASSVVRNATNPNELDVLYAPFVVVGLINVNNTVQFRKYSAAAAAAIAAA